MNDTNRREAEGAVRASCAPYGEDVVTEILMKVRALPDMEDGHAFAASVGDIAAAVLRAKLRRERAALDDLNSGIKAMNRKFPRGPSGLN
jgi:bacterioferritin (cytochrome b1)